VREQLDDLLAHLDDMLEHLDHRVVEPCDETLAKTRRWAEEKGVPWGRLETGCLTLVRAATARSWQTSILTSSSNRPIALGT
jgi:hypothetical protein